MTTKRAALYIRQSATRDQDTALSESVQLDAGKKLAGYDGIPFAKVRVFTDLGKSGGAGKENRRPQYQALLRAVEAGEIDVVYALNLSRLGRSLAELLRFALLCQSKGVTIHAQKEGKRDPGDPMSKAFFNMSATFAELERDMAVGRMLDNVAERRRRGERLGHAPYHEREGNQFDVMVRLYKETGSLAKTCRGMNDLGIPPVYAKRWTGTSVKNALRLGAPDLLPTKAARGVKPRSASILLYRLVRCYCGRTMTGYRKGVYTYYRCYTALYDPTHGKPWIINQNHILPRLREELAAIKLRYDDVESAVAEVRSKVAALEAQRAKITDVYQETDTMTREEYLSRLARIAERITDLTAERRAHEVVVPDLDAEGADAGDLNVALRDLFNYIEIDRRLTPVYFAWSVERLREAPAAASA